MGRFGASGPVDLNLRGNDHSFLQRFSSSSENSEIDSIISKLCGLPGEKSHEECMCVTRSWQCNARGHVCC